MRVSIVVVFALGMLLAGCGSSSKTSTSSPTSGSTPTSAPSVTTAPAPSSAGGPAITIGNDGMRFMFTTTPVKAGATVTVKNNTAVQHTVSADTTFAGFDVTLDPGKTVTFTAPAKAGAYRFHCNIHTYMTGTLTVT
jgi:plastocyanin